VTRPQIDSTGRPGTDFSKFRSYAWIPKDMERVPDSMARNAQADRSLRALIDGHLAREGLAKVGEKPDLYVTYVTGVRDSLGETVWGQGYGGSGPGRSHGALNRRDAEIIIELIEVATMERVWRGWAKVTIDQFEDASPIAERALEMLFEEYPPK
jgi:hypothetical protein